MAYLDFDDNIERKIALVDSRHDFSKTSQDTYLQKRGEEGQLDCTEGFTNNIQRWVLFGNANAAEKQLSKNLTSTCKGRNVMGGSPEDAFVKYVEDLAGIPNTPKNLSSATVDPFNASELAKTGTGGSPGWSGNNVKGSDGPRMYGQRFIKQIVNVGAIDRIDWPTDAELIAIAEDRAPPRARDPVARRLQINDDINAYRDFHRRIYEALGRRAEPDGTISPIPLIVDTTKTLQRASYPYFCICGNSEWKADPSSTSDMDFDVRAIEVDGQGPREYDINNIKHTVNGDTVTYSKILPAGAAAAAGGAPGTRDIVTYNFGGDNRIKPNSIEVCKDKIKDALNDAIAGRALVTYQPPPGGGGIQSLIALFDNKCNIYNTLTYGFSNEQMEKIAVPYIAKRAGDQLQVEVCKQPINYTLHLLTQVAATGAERIGKFELRPIPGAEGGPQIEIQNCVFWTYDRVAAMYAVLNGITTVLQLATKDVVIYRNTTYAPTPLPPLPLAHPPGIRAVGGSRVPRQLYKMKGGRSCTRGEVAGAVENRINDACFVIVLQNLCIPFTPTYDAFTLIDFIYYFIYHTSIISSISAIQAAEISYNNLAIFENDLSSAAASVQAIMAQGAQPNIDIAAIAATFTVLQPENIEVTRRVFNATALPAEVGSFAAGTAPFFAALNDATKAEAQAKVINYVRQYFTLQNEHQISEAAVAAIAPARAHFSLFRNLYKMPNLTLNADYCIRNQPSLLDAVELTDGLLADDHYINILNTGSILMLNIAQAAGNTLGGSPQVLAAIAAATAKKMEADNILIQRQVGWQLAAKNSLVGEGGAGSLLEITRQILRIAAAPLAGPAISAIDDISQVINIYYNFYYTAGARNNSILRAAIVSAAGADDNIGPFFLKVPANPVGGKSLILQVNDLCIHYVGGGDNTIRIDGLGDFNLSGEGNIINSFSPSLDTARLYLAKYDIPVEGGGKNNTTTNYYETWANLQENYQSAAAHKLFLQFFALLANCENQYFLQKDSADNFYVYNTDAVRHGGHTQIEMMSFFDTLIEEYNSRKSHLSKLDIFLRSFVYFPFILDKIGAPGVLMDIRQYIRIWFNYENVSYVEPKEKTKEIYELMFSIIKTAYKKAENIQNKMPTDDKLCANYLHTVFPHGHLVLQYKSIAPPEKKQQKLAQSTIIQNKRNKWNTVKKSANGLTPRKSFVKAAHSGRESLTGGPATGGKHLTRKRRKNKRKTHKKRKY